MDPTALRRSLRILQAVDFPEPGIPTKKKHEGHIERIVLCFLIVDFQSVADSFRNTRLPGDHKVLVLFLLLLAHREFFSPTQLTKCCKHY